MKKTISGLIILLSASVLMAQSLTPANADTLIRHHFADSSFIIMDVCTDANYASRHLQNAVHHYVYSATFASDLDAMNKSKRYLLTCTSGSMSLTAMSTMNTKGFLHYNDISGGVTNWVSAGFRVTTSTEMSIIRFLTAAEFSARLSGAVSPVIIDLRSDSLFQHKRLVNSVNTDTAKNKIETTFPDKTRPYFIYGNTLTAHDTTVLYSMYLNGYRNVYFLKSGFAGWQSASLPVDSSSDNHSSLKPGIMPAFSVISYGESILVIPDFTGPANYYLISADGRIVSEGRISGETYIQVGYIPHGIYILRLISEKGNESKALML